MKKEVKKIDVEGHITLKVIEEADHFNEWVYKTISPNCSGKILEIGSGIGNISKFFIEDKREIILSDLRDNYSEILKEKYTNLVLKIDLVHPTFDLEYKDLLETFDSIFASNVIEHIENDVLAISNCTKLLKRGGVLTILVPAHQWLYCNLDQELEHFRRYTKKSLQIIIKKNQLQIVKTFCFNIVGILGWFWTGKIMNKKIIPEGQMNLFNLLVPVFKLADAVTFRKIGLSVVCVSVK